MAKKLFKRATAVALSLVMCLTLLPGAAFAEKVECEHQWTYSHCWMATGAKIPNCATAHDDVYRCVKCSATEKRLGQTHSHAMQYKQNKLDKDHHTAYCTICVWQETLRSHKYANATCKTPGKCVCGKEDPSGMKDPDNHEGTLGEWEAQGDEHVGTYSCCGTPKSHTPQWSGYVLDAGGETETATCSVCSLKDTRNVDPEPTKPVDPDPTDPVDPDPSTECTEKEDCPAEIHKPGCPKHEHFWVIGEPITDTTHKLVCVDMEDGCTAADVEDCEFSMSDGNGKSYCKCGNVKSDSTDPDPTDPTDPVNPDPTDPVDPDPTDPVNPDPTDPVNPNPGPTDPVGPVGPGGTEIEDPEVPLGGGDDIEIDDPDVPLAGLMTRAEFVNYLYVQEGSPEAAAPTFTDVAGDHEYAAAIGWAQANGVAVGIGNNEFAPDDLVIVEEAELFLERYTRLQDLEEIELAALADKEPDDILDNADEVLTEFFAKLEEARNEED